MPPPTALPDRSESPHTPSRASDVPPNRSNARVTVATECNRCGHEPDDARRPPPRCPKCGGSAWSRFARLTPTPDVGTPGADHARRSKRAFERPVHRMMLRT